MSSTQVRSCNRGGAAEVWLRNGLSFAAAVVRVFAAEVFAFVLALSSSLARPAPPPSTMDENDKTKIIKKVGAAVLLSSDIGLFRGQSSAADGFS